MNHGHYYAVNMKNVIAIRRFLYDWSFYVVQCNITLCRMIMPVSGCHFWHLLKIQFRINPYIPTDQRPLPGETVKSMTTLDFLCVSHDRWNITFKINIPQENNDSHRRYFPIWYFEIPIEWKILMVLYFLQDNSISLKKFNSDR